MKDKKKEFLDHYYSMFTMLDSAILEKVKKYDPKEDFFKRNYILSNIPEKYFEFEFEKIKAKILTTEQI